MTFRFSGHETFPCRYAWLPKAYAALEHEPQTFSDEEAAMIQLGVGKNMVRAIRFWVHTAGVAVPRPAGGYEVTPFGRAVLKRNGFDPFLEDIQTLWLIHWQLSTHVEEPLFAWDYVLNRWQGAEISRSALMRVFTKEAERLERPLSQVTLEQHFDTFLHTYVATRSRKGEIQEDNLDCPLVELELIQAAGERRVDSTGRRETIYVFRRDEKPEISPALFAYCVDSYWRQRKPHEKTLSFRDVTVAQGSPGQIFKLPEWNIRQRLETIEADTDGAFRYRDSATLPQLSRGNESDRRDLLAAIYS